MKKIFYVLVVVAFVSFLSACAPKPEKLIVGTWTLENAEITNIDEVVKAQVENQTKMIDDSIKSIEAKLKTAKAEAKKSLDEQKAQYEKSKAEITADKVKESMTKPLSEMAGKSTLTFKEDKTSEYNFGGQAGKGTYTIAADGKSMVSKEGDKEEKYEIVELTNAKFVCTGVQKADNMELKIKFAFKK